MELLFKTSTRKDPSINIVEMLPERSHLLKLGLRYSVGPTCNFVGNDVDCTLCLVITCVNQDSQNDQLHRFDSTRH